MVERSVHSLLDITWLKDLCICSTGSVTVVERSVYSLLDFTWLKGLCIFYWTSRG